MTPIERKRLHFYQLFIHPFLEFLAVLLAVVSIAKQFDPTNTFYGIAEENFVRLPQVGRTNWLFLNVPTSLGASRNKNLPKTASIQPSNKSGG